MSQWLHFLLCNLWDIFAPGPRKMGAHVDLPSIMRYLDGWLRFSRYILLCITKLVWCRIAVAVNLPMGVDARSCMNVFGTSDSKFCRRQSLCDEWRCTSHCPHQLVGLLVCSPQSSQHCGNSQCTIYRSNSMGSNNSTRHTLRLTCPRQLVGFI